MRLDQSLDIPSKLNRSKDDSKKRKAEVGDCSSFETVEILAHGLDIEDSAILPVS